MDETLKKPPLVIPKTSLFLGCFGFSGKNSTKSKPVQTHIIKTTKKKKRPWLSPSRFGCERTVPVVESTLSEKKKIHDKRTYSTRRAKLECKSIDIPASPTPNPTVSHQIPPRAQEISSSEEPPRLKPGETGHGSVSNEKIILEHGKSLEHDGSPIDTNNKRLGFRQSSDAIKTRSTQRDNQNSGRPTSVSHSISFPNPVYKESLPARVTVKKPQKDSGAMAKSSSDPMVGVSIITVTLLLMLLCGRVCAVLCTCAWFYFVPRLRTVVDPLDCDRKIGSIEPDLDSEEHKKRVVLEGLLERNHRSPT
ncbi:hypothetical protein K2173_006901 [Erythroxylum novogranatense]|uniref:Transmembrane protein n=1 Tax=Erythroxylum novogranatense TaxID=1862640 RepID=A0AAV8SY21_9ROSI|nr:hypothetical protein K2173_006901 [Erythroxylum novogranatense]